MTSSVLSANEPLMQEHWEAIKCILSDLCITIDHVNHVTAIIYNYSKDLTANLVIGLFIYTLVYLHGGRPGPNFFEKSTTIRLSEYIFDHPEVLNSDLLQLVDRNIQYLLPTEDPIIHDLKKYLILVQHSN